MGRGKDTSKRRFWTVEEITIVREKYPHVQTAKLAAHLGRTLLSTYQAAQKLGLRKTDEYLATPDACRLRRGDDIGAPYRFEKGHVPMNKGLRRPGWAPGRMKETQFVKGQSGHNWKPVGSRRLVDGYDYTKVSDVRCVPWTVNWKPTHVILWELHHGPVPKGQALVFVNRDRADIRIENLEMISRADLARRNSIHNLPPELKKTIHTLGAVKRRIRRMSEKQDRRSA